MELECPEGKNRKGTIIPYSCRWTPEEKGEIPLRHSRFTSWRYRILSLRHIHAKRSNQRNILLCVLLYKKAVRYGSWEEKYQEVFYAPLSELLKWCCYWIQMEWRIFIRYCRQLMKNSKRFRIKAELIFVNKEVKIQSEWSNKFTI